MRKLNPAEQRLHPRLDHRLPVRIATEDYDFKTTTHNISCLGAYCTINKYIPPFTRIMIKLELPLIAHNKKEIITIDCSGVIVRTDDAPKGEFNIAIFFNRINDTQRHKISKYIEQFLPQETACLN